MTRPRNEPETEELDERNRRAPHVNPEHSGGIPTGNPQLDPDHASKAGKRRRGRGENNPPRDSTED